MAHFRMEIESLSENEEFARVVAAVFMSRMNPTLEQVEDVKTAVSEAVTNAVIHGYQNGEGIIVLEGEIRGEWLTVTVKDRGTGIQDVKRAMEPLYTTDKTGERSGMGFSFMEAFMDQVQVESEPGKGTVVRMKKEIRQESGQAQGAYGVGEAEKCLEGTAGAGEQFKKRAEGKAEGKRQEGAFKEAQKPDSRDMEKLSEPELSGIAETACTREAEVMPAVDGGSPVSDTVRTPKHSGTLGTKSAPAYARSSRTAQVIQSILSIHP